MLQIPCSAAGHLETASALAVCGEGDKGRLGTGALGTNQPASQHQPARTACCHPCPGCNPPLMIPGHGQPSCRADCSPPREEMGGLPTKQSHTKVLGAAQDPTLRCRTSPCSPLQHPTRHSLSQGHLVLHHYTGLAAATRPTVACCVSPPCLMPTPPRSTALAISSSRLSVGPQELEAGKWGRALLWCTMHAGTKPQRAGSKVLEGQGRDAISPRGCTQGLSDHLEHRAARPCSDRWGMGPFLNATRKVEFKER